MGSPPVFIREVRELAMYNMGRTRDAGHPLEVWQWDAGRVRWLVLRRYQSPHREASRRYARWYCLVFSPVTPQGEYGDCYVADVKKLAHRV